MRSYADYERITNDILYLQEGSVNGITPRFTALREVGKGTATTVYQAYDRDLDQTVAIKLFNSTISHAVADILKREVRIARRISHPNVVRLFDLHLLQPRSFLTMEYVDGCDLRQMLKDNGPLSIVDAVLVATQLCDGLAAIHAAGVIHCDVRPENIIVSSNRTVLTDLGVAAYTNEILPRSRRTGTLLYRSPEQFMHDRLDARTDIYSLGLVLFELLTGRQSYDHPYLAEHLGDINSIVPTKNPRECNDTVPDWLAAIVRRCLEPHKENRYQTAAELAQALHTAAALPPPQADSHHSSNAAPSALLETCGIGPDSDQDASEASNDPTLDSLNRPTIQNNTLLIVAVATTVCLFLVLIVSHFGSPASRPAAEVSVAVMPFDITSVPLSLHGLLEALERDLYTRLNTNRRIRLWHSDDHTRALQLSGIPRSPTLIIETRLTCAGGLTATGTIRYGNRSHTQSLFTVEGTPRDLLQFSNQLLRVILADRNVRGVLKSFTTAPPPTTDPEAYFLFCRANAILHADASTLSDLRQGLTLLTQATARDPSFAAAYATRAALDLALYRREPSAQLLSDAWSASDRVYHIQPTTPLGRSMMAAVYLATNNTAQALQILSEPSLLQTDTVLRLRGSALLSAGAIQQAVNTLQQSIEINPLSVQSYLILADCLISLVKYEDAIAAYDNALIVDHNNPTALANLGECYLRLGQYNKAILNLQRALQVHADAANYANLANAYLSTGQPALSVALLEKATEIDCHSDIYLGYLGEVYQAVGDPRATQTLQKARTIAYRQSLAEPLHSDALSRTAVYDARLGRTAIALGEIRRALRLSPGDSDVLYRLAIVQTLAKELEDATETLIRLGSRGYCLPFEGRDYNTDILEHIPAYGSLRHKYGRHQ